MSEKVIQLKRSFGSLQIGGAGISAYLIMLVIFIAAVRLDKLPTGILGALAVLVLLGNVFHAVGNHLPIIKSYLGGGVVFCIFSSALLSTFGVLPQEVLKTCTVFVTNMGFLDFYIAALITGSILGMKRDLLITASVRFIPVALMAMLAAFLMVGLVGMLIGQGFRDSVLYVSLPVMAGGVGAGVVPLSGIYAAISGQPSSEIISRLIPASALGNVLAIIGAALIAKIGTSFPGCNGNGAIMKADLGEMNEEKKEFPTDILSMGTGLLTAIAFFTLGSILNHFVPQVHAYAFMIIAVVICKVTDIIPSYYEDCAVMFNHLIVKNLTPAVLSGIGIALLNLNVLAQSLTWQFVVLCMTSILTISIAAGVIGKFFGLYPVESMITAGLCNNSMGGTGNVAVLSASNRMGLIAFAQMGNRLGGAIVLIASGFLMSML